MQFFRQEKMRVWKRYGAVKMGQSIWIRDMCIKVKLTGLDDDWKSLAVV